MRLFELFNLNEARAPALAAKYKNKIESRLSEDHSAPWPTYGRFTEFLESKFNRYTEWVLIRYLNKNFLFEDLPRVQDAIAQFEQKKSKLEKKDINQYKTLSELEDAVGLLDDVKSTRQQKQEIKNEGIKKIYEDGKYLLAELLTERAACFYGNGTKWCTAARENNMFDNYANQGPLYIVIDKQDNRKYQLHYETLQFMDEQDEEIDYRVLKRMYPAIQKIEPNNPADFSNTNRLIKFIDVVKGNRWPAAEKIILNSNPTLIVEYIVRVIKDRWPEAESKILTDFYAASWYMEKIIGENSRWSEFESKLLSAPVMIDELLRYAVDYANGRWPEAEKYIIQKPWSASGYAIRVMKKRWPEAEPTIAKDPGEWKHYATVFDIK